MEATNSLYSASTDPLSSESDHPLGSWLRERQAQRVLAWGYRPQKARTDLKQRAGSFNRLTAHDLDVVNELPAVDNDPQGRYGADLEGRACFQQTTRGTVIEDAGPKIARKYAQSV
jgi:hypothetical protein